MDITPFELKLQEVAYYGEGELQTTDLNQILPSDLTYLSKGFFSRVYRLPDQGWVIKEGRWDLDMKVYGQVDLPIPARLLQLLLSPFAYHFQPTPLEITNQYKDYLVLAEYFGYFTPENYYHPKLSQLQNRQREIREGLSKKAKHIATKHHLTIPKTLLELFSTDAAFTNFLPKEYLLYGPSLTKSQHGKPTSFIVQEFIKGRELHDVTVEQMNKSQKEKLLLLLYLILVFHHDTGLLPDTRPRYLLTQVNDWFYSTDNILLTDAGDVRYLDTRWLWPANKKLLVRRGFVFPELIISSVKKWIPRLASP